jgi:DNA modification methylase
MKVKLIHGDCLEEMKRLPDRSIDLFLCDLPYGCLGKVDVVPKLVGNHHNRTKAMSGCAWDIKIDLEAFWEQVERLMKDDHTPIIHFCNTKFGVDLIISNPKWFRYDLVWNKMRGVSFLSANKMPMRSHENIYVFAKKGARYNRVDVDDETKKERDETKRKTPIHANTYNNGETLPSSCVIYPAGKRCALSVIESMNTPKKGKHPTQKPNDLYKWLIERYSKPGDTILDPTAGSFASCFTAIDCGRQAIGIEMNDTFYEKAVRITEA